MLIPAPQGLTGFFTRLHIVEIYIDNEQGLIYNIIVEKNINNKKERIEMKNLHRIVDYQTFAGSINKSKRKELVDHIRKERRKKNLPDSDIQIMPLYGWYEGTKSIRDDGLIRAIIKIKDVVFIVYDNLTKGAEDFHFSIIDDDIMEFIGATAQTAPTKKDGTPFAGWNGGRKKKELTDEEKAKIREMRNAGSNINAIAKALHISNRVIAEFVKTN